MGAEQLELVAQEIAQQCARLGISGPVAAVDAHAHAVPSVWLDAQHLLTISLRVRKRALKRPGTQHADKLAAIGGISLVIFDRLDRLGG